MLTKFGPIYKFFRKSPKAGLVLGFAVSFGFWVLVIGADFYGSRNTISENRQVAAGGLGSIAGVKTEPENQNSDGRKLQQDLGVKAPGSPSSVNAKASGPPAPKSEQITGGIEENKPAVDSLLLALEPGLVAKGDGWSVVVGEISFTTKSNWGEADKHLVWGNYNGHDVKNLFQIVSSGNLLVFDIYGADGESTQECNVELSETTSGREIDVKVSWDFTASVGSKKVYVNNVLKRECTTPHNISDNGGKIFTGDISNFSVTL